MKEISSVDGETGRKEEFVVADLVAVAGENFALRVETAIGSLGKSHRRCSFLPWRR